MSKAVSQPGRFLELPEQWHPADILAFSGRGPVSWTIKAGTCSSISHVAGIGHVPRWQLQRMVEAGALEMSRSRLMNWQDRYLLFESTTLSPYPCVITGQEIHGVQAHEPRMRIANYEGRVWLYRLTDAWRRDFTSQYSIRLTGHLLARIGQQYDGRGAILSGTKIVKHFWAWRKVDRSSLFCSEYLAAVLQHVRLFPISNSSKVTPGGLIRTLVEAEVYQPGVLIKG